MKILKIIQPIKSSSFIETSKIYLKQRFIPIALLGILTLADIVMTITGRIYFGVGELSPVSSYMMTSGGYLYWGTFRVFSFFFLVFLSYAPFYEVCDKLNQSSITTKKVEKGLRWERIAIIFFLSVNAFNFVWNSIALYLYVS